MAFSFNRKKKKGLENVIYILAINSIGCGTVDLVVCLANKHFLQMCLAR